MVLGPVGYGVLTGLSGVGAVLIKNSLMKLPHLARKYIAKRLCCPPVGSLPLTLVLQGRGSM